MISCDVMILSNLCLFIPLISHLPSGYLTVRHGIDGPFIDGLAINSMVIFHGYVSHNQMVMFPPYVHMMSFDVFCTQEMMGCCLSNDIVKIPEF